MKNWNFEMLQPAHGGVTEGPAWDGSGLLFTRIQQSRIMRYDPAGGPLRLPLRLPAPPRARNTAALSSSAVTWNTRITLTRPSRDSQYPATYVLVSRRLGAITMIHDLRYALRALARNPAFAIPAIVATALGVGATTAVFSVVDRILFRALPYAREERLVSAGMMAPLDSNEFMFASEYFELRRDPGPFEAVTSFQAGALACDLTEQNPLRLRCLRIEANFLPVFGISPLLGRTFTAEEDRPNGPRVAMISHGLWRSRFAGDPNVTGRTIPIDGAAGPGPLPTRAMSALPSTLKSATATSAAYGFWLSTA